MDKIFEAIESIHTDINQELDNILEADVAPERLLAIESRLSMLFHDIRVNGVCKADIRELNGFGITAADERYFTELKSSMGLEVALENENVKTGVVAAVLIGLSAILGWIVGKFVRWVMDSTGKVSDAVKSIAATSILSSEASNDKLPKMSEVGKKAYANKPNACVIHNLRLEDGKRVKALFEQVSTFTDSLAERVKTLAKAEAYDSLLKDVTDTGLTKAWDSIEFDADYTKFLGECRPLLVELMGEKLTNHKVKLPQTGGDTDYKSNMGLSILISTTLKPTTMFKDTVLKHDDLRIRSMATESVIVDKRAESTLSKNVDDLDKSVKAFSKSAGAQVALIVGAAMTPEQIKSKQYTEAKKVLKRKQDFELVYPSKFLGVVNSSILTNLLKGMVDYAAIGYKKDKLLAMVFDVTEVDKLKALADLIYGNAQDADYKKIVDGIDDVVKNQGKKSGLSEIEACEFFIDILQKLKVKNDEVKVAKESDWNKVAFTKHTNASFTSKPTEVITLILRA